MANSRNDIVNPYGPLKTGIRKKLLIIQFGRFMTMNQAVVSITVILNPLLFCLSLSVLSNLLLEIVV